MASVGLLPAIPLILGAAIGVAAPIGARAAVWMLASLWVVAAGAWWLRTERPLLLSVAAAFLLAGVALGGHARAAALATPLRLALDRAIGGVAIETLGPAGDHDPIPLRAELLEDAADFGDYASLRVRAVEVQLDHVWIRVSGGVALSVGGEAFRGRVRDWRAGRLVEAPVTFRRPARYLNDGVPDFERDLALDGTTLFGSIKSGLIVDVSARGTSVQEAAAQIRAHVRRVVDRRIAGRDAVAGAIVTAVLIGDRSGLPDEIRERLQAAGTYHVIAISGGNIAILAGLAIATLMAVGIRGRTASLLAALALVGYAQVATAGPSVWRATLMAVIYLSARALDLRTPPWQAIAVAAGLMVIVRPLEVRDVGFILTFGATAALVEGVRRGARARSGRVIAWVVATVVASISVELALLPVSAHAFSRVSFAGLALNLIAVPLMGVVQLAGLAVSCLDGFDPIATLAAGIARIAAQALVGSTALVDAAPWLSARVPPPHLALLVVYYAALSMTLAARHLLRVAAVAVLAGTLVALTSGSALASHADALGQRLRLTMFDVGQAEAILLEVPGAAPLLVDAAGVPFGRGLDVGTRVLAPALWARGVRSLGALLVTHGDPDHIGGAAAVVNDFRPAGLWEGIVVPGHRPSTELRIAARARGARLAALRAGGTIALGGARVRVLHPPEPDWERPAVRNDDSLVLEVVYGGVALVLAGDISAEVEREVTPSLTPAATRVLKVAHHGSRTSSSREWLEGWRPQIALISAGRGNTFDHPAPDVLRRLATVGATVYRTDRHGQITLETDGHDVRVSTFIVSTSPNPDSDRRPPNPEP